MPKPPDPLLLFALRRFHASARDCCLPVQADGAVRLPNGELVRVVAVWQREALLTWRCSARVWRLRSVPPAEVGAALEALAIFAVVELADSVHALN